MRLLKIDEIKEDMVCAKPVFTTNGTVLINKGTKLRNKYVERLVKHGIRRIYIRNDLVEDIIVDEIIKEEVMREAVKIVEESLNDMFYYKNIDIDKVKDIINTVILELLSTDNLIVQLVEIRSVNEYTLQHCVKVAVLSLIVGLELNYSKEDLIDLGTGAILHDVGKALIPREIINKPSRLTETEFETIKEHTNLGYLTTKRQKGLSDRVREIILHHHERFDGRGYPDGLKGEEIPEYVRIVSIADVFDALTSDRVYRKRIDSNLAIEYLISMGGTQFDYSLVKVFMKNIALYPIGKGVKLSNGQQGFVLNNTKNFPSRPLVNVVLDSEGNILDRPYRLDLMECNKITVVGTFA